MRRSSHSFVAIPSVRAGRSEVLGAASARVDSAGVESRHMHTDILPADRELATHGYISRSWVAGRPPPRAHAAALRFPADYVQVDWGDPSESPLPNPEIQFPRLARPAAFACTQSTCSNPMYDPASIAPTVNAELVGSDVGSYRAAYH